MFSAIETVNDFFSHFLYCFAKTVQFGQRTQWNIKEAIKMLSKKKSYEMLK